MPSRLVILAEEVLFQGGAEAPGRAGFDALARLTHAGHPVAVILAGTTSDSHAARALQQLASDAGAQLVAFFHRPADGGGLDDVLNEITARWRVDPGQVQAVFGRLDDLAVAVSFGATPVALSDQLGEPAELPEACLVHTDLAAFVDALLGEPDPEA